MAGTIYLVDRPDGVAAALGSALAEGEPSSCGKNVAARIPEDSLVSAAERGWNRKNLRAISHLAPDIPNIFGPLCARLFRRCARKRRALVLRGTPPATRTRTMRSPDRGSRSRCPWRVEALEAILEALAGPGGHPGGPGRPWRVEALEAILEALAGPGGHPGGPGGSRPWRVEALEGAPGGRPAVEQVLPIPLGDGQSEIF
jgi:hypothetical protein